MVFVTFCSQNVRARFLYAESDVVRCLEIYITPTTYRCFMWKKRAVPLVVTILSTVSFFHVKV